MSIAQLGYVVIETLHPADWRRFWESTVGLVPVENDSPRCQHYRLDDRAYRIVVEQADTERFRLAGWEIASEADFEAQIARLQKHGTRVERQSATQADARQVAALARAVDPNGNLFELYYGRTLSYVPFVSPAGVSGFVTGEMGLGHVGLPAPDIEAARKFYLDVMGFGLTDTMTVDEKPSASPLKIYFMHADNARHHSCAIAATTAPSGLLHMMLEASTVDDVGRFMDRCERDKVPVAATLGRHSNDRMLSVYVMTPGGFRLEFGCNGLQIDWKTWIPTRSLVADLWGHKRFTLA